MQTRERIRSESNNGVWITRLDSLIKRVNGKATYVEHTVQTVAVDANDQQKENEMNSGETVYSGETVFGKKLSELLIGNSIVRVGKSTLTLENGKVLQIKTDTNMCLCGNGKFNITGINCSGGIIDSVETELKETVREDATEEDSEYRIFVKSGGTKRMILEVKGFYGQYTECPHGPAYEITVSEENG